MYEQAILSPPPPERGWDELWIKAQLLLEKGFPLLGSDVISLKIEENLPRTYIKPCKKKNTIFNNYKFISIYIKISL